MASTLPPIFPLGLAAASGLTAPIQEAPVQGLAFGKFAPFHKGHEMLIREALDQCDQLTVFISNRPELTDIPPQDTADLMRTIIGSERLRIVIGYDEPARGDTPEDTEAHIGYLQRYLPSRFHKVFCNEWYGKKIAAAFDAEWIQCDPERTTHPVSASRIRSDPKAHAAHLHPLMRERVERARMWARTPEEALWTAGMDASFVDREMSPSEKDAVLDRSSGLNPGYEPAKLRHMMAWDVGQYERPHLPSLVGVVEDKAAYSRHTGMRVLDMAIRMPGQGWAIPKAFEQFKEVIRMAVEQERAVNPDFDDHYYVYFTVDQKIVEPGKAQRRVGWHGDAFVSPETSDLDREVITDNTYVIFDALSTLFLEGPFSLKGVDATNIREVLKRFDETAAGKPPRRYPPYQLLRMTPYDVHTPDVNTTGERIVRTFVKIQFSRDRLNMLGNGVNRVLDPDGKPALSYSGWAWVARDPKKRNNRNSIIGWDREDKADFRLINRKEVDFSDEAAHAPWAEGNFFWAKKIEGVHAERARPDEILETISEGRFRSTFNIAQEGDWKITTSQGDQYFLSDEAFKRRYYAEHPSSDRFYLPRSVPTKMLRITEPVRYRAPWGAWAYAPAGSVLVRLNEDDVYAVLPGNFRNSYIRTDAGGNILNVPTEARPAFPSPTEKNLVRVPDHGTTLTPPYLAVFDLHGTLLQPNWKLAMARVYQDLVPDADFETALRWVEENTYSKSDREVLESVAGLREGTAVGDVREMFQKQRSYVGRNFPMQAFPGAASFLEGLKAREMPTFVATFAHTNRSRTVGQLRESGLLPHVGEDHVITKESTPEARDKEEFRNMVLRRLHELYQGAQILFFNDTADGMPVTRQLGGVNFGVPQGRDKDWEYRAAPLIENGAHYLIQDWEANGPEILGLIATSNPP